MPFHIWANFTKGNNTTAAPPVLNGSVPPTFLQHLTALEPDAQFEFLPPDLIKSSNDVLYHAKTGTIQKPVRLHKAEAKLINILNDVAPQLVPKVIASGY